MPSLNLADVETGEVLDTVTLTGGGELAYDTGRARTMFEAKLAADGRLTPAELFDQMSGWSNGYVALRPDA